MSALRMASVGLLVPLAFFFAPGCGSGSNGSSNGPGSLAHALLSADTYSSLLIEIQAVQGFEPTVDAQGRLQQFLSDRLNKPSGIQIVMDSDLPSPGKTTYTLSDVQAIETANRKHQTAGAQIAAYFLFLDGHSTSDAGGTQILGQAYGPTSMVIYEKAIRDNSGGGIASGQPATNILEATVLQHEFGHLMGLVNLGSPAQSGHQDSGHGAHCNVTTCLMYYLADTSGILGNLLGGNVPSLDSNCLQDLKANGGK